MKKRGRRLSKKAAAGILMMELFQLAASVMVLTTELVFIGGIAERFTVEKNMYARDTAMLVDLMYGTPSNFNYLYHVKAMGEELFNFNISGFTSSVSTGGYPLPASYGFYENMGLERIRVSEKEVVGFFRFFKEGNKISASKEGKGNMLLLQCSNIKTSQSGWKSIPVVLDPGHGGNDKGFANSRDASFYESEITIGIANAIGLAGRISNNVMTRTGDVEKSESARKSVIEKEKGIVIGIRVGSNTKTLNNPIKVYINAEADKETREKSAKLGCLIINSLLSNKDEDIQDINMVGIAPTGSSVLPNDRPGVILELGNIQIAKNKNFLRQQSDIAQSVSDAAAEYFK